MHGKRDNLGTPAVLRVVWITLGLNVLVAAAKVVIGRLAGSVSVEADGYHSMSDAANNVVGLVAITAAIRPPDTGHPYGHKKIETFSALGIGTMLLATAAMVGWEAAQRLGHPQRPTMGLWSIGVMIGTLIVNILVARYEYAAGKRLKSAFLQADALHTTSDIAVSAGVLASLMLSSRWPIADPLAGVAVAAVIAWVGAHLLLHNIQTLLDAARVDTAHIKELAMGLPGVVDCHEIRTRGPADDIHVDLHLLVPQSMTLQAAHDLADAVEHRILEAVEGVTDVVVHVEPAETHHRNEDGSPGDIPS